MRKLLGPSHFFIYTYETPLREVEDVHRRSRRVHGGSCRPTPGVAGVAVRCSLLSAAVQARAVGPGGGLEQGLGDGGGGQTAAVPPPSPHTHTMLGFNIVWEQLGQGILPRCILAFLRSFSYFSQLSQASVSDVSHSVPRKARLPPRKPEGGLAKINEIKQKQSALPGSFSYANHSSNRAEE